MFPILAPSVKLKPDTKRIFIGAYGSEERSLGWLLFHQGEGAILDNAFMFRYRHTKGNRNRIAEIRKALTAIGAAIPINIIYDARSPFRIEDSVAKHFQPLISSATEIVLDISAMTKLLILVSLCELHKFVGTLRIVYSEAQDYVPSREDYEKAKEGMELIAKYPSRGFQSVIRTKCLSSIRMQGQPITLVAFTSFNEQLVRHMLGTLSPHRLLFINGRPPRNDYEWREWATQEIHQKIIEQYLFDNPLDNNGHLTRVSSTLNYIETIHQFERIYKQYGNYERLICAATGSKMQTLGLFFAKVLHPDIHIEYPTPDSYFVKGASEGIRKVHEIVFPRFSDFLASLHQK